MSIAPPRIILLCNGSGEKWRNILELPKQMVPYNGIALLQRTINKLRKYSDDIWVVRWDERINVEGAQVLSLSPTRWTVETLLATQHLWTENVIVLLGDVFFSNWSIKRIFSFKTRPVVFGRIGRNEYTGCGHGELYGLAFNVHCQKEIETAARIALEHAENGGKGKIWQIYNALSGNGMNSQCVVPGLLCPINDYTDDIDNPNEYYRNCKMLNLAANDSFAAQFLLVLTNLAHLFKVHLGNLKRAYLYKYKHNRN